MDKTKRKALARRRNSMAAFGDYVLRRLEGDADWSMDDLQDIAVEAHNLGLAEFSSGHFERSADAKA